MKLTPWYLAAIAPIAVAGCSGALLGQLAVLALTIGIFVGTLSLGRHTHAKNDRATAQATAMTATATTAQDPVPLPGSGEEAPS